MELGDVKQIGTSASGTDGVMRMCTVTLHNEDSMIPIWPANLTRDETHVVGDETLDLGTEITSGQSFINLLFDTEHTYSRANFSPRDQNSPLNRFNGQYEPLLFPLREMQLKVAATLPGEAPTNWMPLFHGVLGDNIKCDGSTVTVTARDLASLLADTFIEEPTEYGTEGGKPAEDVIQDILNDWMGKGQVTLYFPSGDVLNPRPETESPGFMVEPYTAEYLSVWDAIQRIASQIGWFIGYRYHANTGQFQLVLMEPPRDKNVDTADFELDYRDDFYVNNLDIKSDEIRNVVKVVYRDASGQEQSVVETDENSIARFRRKFMQLAVADTGFIRTEADARALAQAALADQKALAATTQINMPLLPEMDVFAGLNVRDDRISSTVDFFGVDSVRHTLDWNSKRFRTEVVASGKVIGGRMRWKRMETRPGSPGNPVPPEKIDGGGIVMPMPYNMQASGTANGILVGFHAPGVSLSRWAESRLFVYDAQGADITLMEPVSSAKTTQFEAVTYWDVTSGSIKDIEPGKMYYARVRHVGTDGKVGYPSVEVSAIAKYVEINRASFPEDLKPVILVNSLPELPHTEFPQGATVFLTTDGKLYTTDGAEWTPVGAGTVTADEIMAGIGRFGGITADYYAEIRNVLPYVGTDSLDADNPIEVDFYIPTETERIVSVLLSAKALRYRAYARTASSGGIHTHSVTIPAHSHYITTITDTVPSYTEESGSHTHGHGSTGVTIGIFSIQLSSAGYHHHTISNPYFDDETSSDGEHEGHVTSITNGYHSHSIDDAGNHGHFVWYGKVYPLSMTEAQEATVETTDFSDEHIHELVYGIMLDTTPANVMLYCHDGANYDTGRALATAPTSNTQEYILATELDLTSGFSGTGWKRIKFTSSRRGRITWQLIAKLDITA